jgi:uncharacterized membrane protein
MSLPSPVAATTAPNRVDPPAPAPPPVRRARTWSLLLLSTLIVLCLAWELWLAPTGSGTLALKVLPLLPCLAGLMRHRLYTYRWLSLLLWLYVTEGLTRAGSEGGLSQGLAVAEVVLSVALFAICVHYIRLRVPKLPRSSSTKAAS